MEPASSTPASRAEPPAASAASDLQQLRRALIGLTGAAPANDLLFRLGERLGRNAAAQLAAHGDEPELKMREGLTRLTELGLGHATLEEFRFDPGANDCHVRGIVRDAGPEICAAHGAPQPTGAICEATVGYLTGFTAGMTGIDVVCSPFECPGPCSACACGFEILPAHRAATSLRGEPAPSGSARFFLRTLGHRLGSADLSLDEIVEDSSDAILLLDNDDRIRFWNGGAERLFGYQRDEVLGRHAEFLLPADLQQADELRRLQQKTIADGVVRSHVTRRLRKDGQELWVSLHRAVLHDSAGQVVGSSATLRDISRLRRTEEELTRARGLALIGQMAAKVAHEVKNPLAGIYAAVQLLGRDMPVTDPRRAVLDTVGAEIRRLDETVQELLRFARPAPAHLRRGDLRTFVQSLVESLAHHPDVARHRVEVAIEDGEMVSFDARLLGQTLTNLILNAGQAIEQDGGLIRVAAQQDEAELRLEVADSGPGIPPDRFEAIFEPFETTKVRGTGLGLAIARQGVEAHGGTLTARNAQCGGAVFTLRIPLPRL